ncbi:MAG: DsbA family protein [Myxococcota bacterium]
MASPPDPPPDDDDDAAPQADRSGTGNLPGSASRQDRSHHQREIQRLLLRAAPRLRRIGFARRELLRRLRGRPHRVHFFHQVDDPYSHLALSAIPRLLERYAVRFVFKLVPPTDRLHAPEPALLTDYARRDCAWIAPHYGLEFPREAAVPAAEDVRRVERVLAGRMGRPDWVETAIELGRALWWNDPAARARLVRLEQARGIGSPSVPDETAAWARETAEAEARRMLEEGDRARRLRGHYSGGMFWYAGEWYWGVDRLDHLERRLIRLGATRPAASDGDRPTPTPTPTPTTKATAKTTTQAKPSGAPHALCFPRPAIDPGPNRNDRGLTLEIFPSLRSPYTAFIFERSLALAREAGVPVVLRPVMPMVMRGVPAPAAKGLYIFLDAKREADALGIPFGNMYDPIGAAVVRGFSLWPFANERGRGAEYIARFLRAAFVEGRRTGSDAGLRRVVEDAGLSWDEARPFLDTDGFRAELEANRKLLYEELGLWGVPSYRLRGPAGEPELCVWGQDRLWLVAAEIRRRLASPSDGSAPADRGTRGA